MNVIFVRLFSLLCCIGQILFVSRMSVAQDLRAEELRRMGRAAFYEGRYPAAEGYLRGSLAMFEARAGSATDIALTQEDLAWSLVANGNYAEAEKLLNSALSMLRRDPDQYCDQMTILLSHLGTLYQKTRRYKQADSTLKQAWERAEQCGPTYIKVVVLNDIGILYGETGKLKQATAALEKALALTEEHPEVNGPVVAQSLTSLAAIYLAEQKLSVAEPLLARARQLLESSLDGSHPDLSITLLSFTLEELGLLYHQQGRLDEAEHQLSRAAQVESLHHVPDPARRARLSFVLAQILTRKGNYERAKGLYQQALPDNVSDTAETAATLEEFSKLLRMMKSDSQAKEMDLRAKRIRAKLAYTVSVK